MGFQPKPQTPLTVGEQIQLMSTLTAQIMSATPDSCHTPKVTQAADLAQSIMDECTTRCTNPDPAPGPVA